MKYLGGMRKYGLGVSKTSRCHEGNLAPCDGVGEAMRTTWERLGNARKHLGPARMVGIDVLGEGHVEYVERHLMHV